MKKFFFILLVILMPIVAKADDSGKCGDNLTWTFVESTGTLTISGTGAMKNYSYNSVPWYNYSSEILKTEIGDSVTSIGEHAFYGCSSLVSVSIPEGVTSIGDYAFYENFNLASISIPNSVMSVGEQAFRCCSNLTSITIPNGVTSIGGFAFEGCSFRELHIPSSLTKIGRGAFGVQSGLLKITVDDNNPVYNDDGDVGGLSLDAVFEKETKKLVVGGSNTTIPGTITKIGPNAFHNCTDLTSIYLRNIAEIDTAAFYGCSNLKTIYLPDALKIINNGAFGLTGLTSITTPEGLDSIGYEAFVKCEKLTKAEINGKAIFGSSLFEGCSSLNEIIIGKTVKSIDMKYGNFFRSLFYHGCPQDLKISVDSRNTNYDSRNNCNAIIETATNTLIQGWNLTTIPESVTSIGSSAFSDCSSLTSITLPESVTSIGSFAFSDCCNLTSITIPEGVTSISGSVFYGCSNLTSITIPDGVTSIGERAFSWCTNLSSITIPEGVTSIGEMAFYNCSSLASVTMGASTPVDITSDVFSNRTNATLYVPYGSKEAYMAASYWSEFKEIVELAPEDITFADAKVKEVCVANWDTNGDGELSMLEAEAVTDLGEVFKNNTEITSFDELQYFTGLTSIGDYAFDGCSNLTSITIPESVTSVGEWAFRGCSFREIHIPSSLTEIGFGAFAVQPGLVTITVDDNNPVYDDGLNNNAIFETATNTLIAGGINTYIPERITKIGNNAFQNCTGLTSVDLHDNIIEIGVGAFNNCSNLTTIDLPDNLKVIGQVAFAQSGLTSITTPEKLDSIGWLVFHNCEELTDVELNARAIFSSGLFGGCTNLKNIKIGQAVKSITHGAFFARSFGNGSSPQNVNIVVDSRNTVYDSRNNCNAIIETATNTLIQGSDLTSIPDNVTSIGRSAFAWCTYLTSITIPKSVTSIGNYAFDRCSNLTSVTMGASTPVDITSDVFSNRANATLYVPYGSKEAYMAASYWKEFKEIVEYGRPTGITITINQYGSSTYCSEFPLDFTNVEGLKAYVAGGFNTSTKTVMMYKVNTTKGNTGLFIKGTPGEYVVPVLESSDDNYMNMLVGTTEQVTVNSKSADGNYVNFKYTIKSGDQKPRFYEFTDGSTLSANKAYLQVPASWLPVTSEARTMNIMFDDEDVTGIEENYEFNMNSDGSVYDLSGRRVNNPTKGMYIVNGKKVVIK